MTPFNTIPPSEYKLENFFPRISDEYRSIVQGRVLIGKYKSSDPVIKVRYKEPFNDEEPIFNVNFPNIRPVKSGQAFKFSSILSSRADHLVRCVSIDNRKVNPTCKFSKVVDVEKALHGKDLVLVVCVFVPAKWCEYNAGNLCQLSLISSELLSNPTFEIIFVPKMRRRPEMGGHYGVDDLHNFMSAFPGRLFLPCTNPEACDYFCKRFNFKGQPTFVLVSRDKVVQVDARYNIFSFGSAGFPFTNDRVRLLKHELPRLPLAELLGVAPSFKLTNLGGSACTTIEDLSEKVVGLYLFRGGENFKVYEQVYKQCRDSDGEESEFQVVLICLPRLSSIHPTVYQEQAFAALKQMGSSFWYFAPKDYSTCLRLIKLSENDYDDAMIIVGPKNQYLEPCGGEILAAFGINAFPFHREEVLERYMDMLEEVTLESLLCRESVQYVLTPDQRQMPIADLRGKNVVLYVGHVENRGTDTFEKVREWCEEMEKQHTDFVVVYTLCRNSDDESMVETPFQGTKWLEYPCDLEHSARLQKHEAFFYEIVPHKPTKPVVGLHPPEVLLFGKDGRLHMMDAVQQLYIQGMVNLFSPDCKDFRNELLIRLRIYLDLFCGC